MAQKRLAEKAEREATLEKQQQEYVADAETESEQILRQLQVDAYNNKVEANTDRLSNAYERAVKDFDILSNADPVIQAELADAIDAFQARYVQMDQNGNPTKVTGDFYTYLQAKADSIQRLTGIAKRTQEGAKTKEKSKALPLPSRAPKQPKVDPDLAGFDEEASRW
jgi:DNA repair exonuclease SbcCD ATPase subunit